MAEQTTEINFKVIFYTEPGQHVRIIGNVEELGQWNYQNSLILGTDHLSYPKWYSRHPIKVQANKKIEFKAVLCDDEKIICWEHLFNNRSVITSPFLNLNIEFVQNDPLIKKKFISYQKENLILQNYEIIQQPKQIAFKNLVQNPNSVKISEFFWYNYIKESDIYLQQKVQRIQQEIKMLQKFLPSESTNPIYLCFDSQRYDIIKALIFGSENTPYADGAFVFDIYLDNTYPQKPPKVNLMTTGNNQIRFNPNLYNSGYVCLSLLGTWSGSVEESWNPKSSNLLQVLISIQTLVMNDDIYFNEPGYQGSKNTNDGKNYNEAYTNIVKFGTVQFAMIDMLINPPPEFEEIIKMHYFLKQNKILDNIQKWLKEAQESKLQQKYYSSLVNSHNSKWCQEFQKENGYYNNLLLGYNKLQQIFKNLVENEIE